MFCFWAINNFHLENTRNFNNDSLSSEASKIGSNVVFYCTLLLLTYPWFVNKLIMSILSFRVFCSTVFPFFDKKIFASWLHMGFPPKLHSYSHAHDLNEEYRECKYVPWLRKCFSAYDTRAYNLHEVIRGLYLLSVKQAFGFVIWGQRHCLQCFISGFLFSGWIWSDFSQYFTFSFS